MQNVNNPQTPSFPRVTILLARSGGGHISAGRSLSEAFEGLADVGFLNLMDDHAPFPINRFSVTYGPWVNYAPWAYEMVYQAFTSRRRVEFLEDAAYPLVKQRIAKALAACSPDLVVSVHPIQVSVPLRALREMGSRAPFITVVTDPVTPPLAWFCPDVDLCIVATEQARKLALSCGMSPDRVRVIGLPVRRAFWAARDQSKPAARTRVGLAAERKLALLTGGGAGIGKVLPMAQAIAQRLAANRAHAQMAIIAGNNQPLQRRLRGEPWPIPVTILGFVENMADWLAAADLLITKAGPGTLAEAACTGVPVIITSFIPGQEAGNVAWVEENRAGVYEEDPQRVAKLAADWLSGDHPALAEMAQRIQALAQCDAARQIAQAALDLLPAPSAA